jgi:hypothetical protein
MNLKTLLTAMAASMIAPLLPGAIIGTNVPAQEITVETIATLPKAQQRAWRKYLEHSDRQKRADQNVLRKEMKRLGLTEAEIPPSDRSARSIPLTRDAAWYGTSNAQLLADNVVSFQTPAGGWSKNLDFAKGPRVPGEHFAPNNLSRFSKNRPSEVSGGKISICAENIVCLISLATWGSDGGT